jgi:hypothetical protein
MELSKSKQIHFGYGATYAHNVHYFAICVRVLGTLKVIIIIFANVMFELRHYFSENFYNLSTLCHTNRHTYMCIVCMYEQCVYSQAILTLWLPGFCYICRDEQVFGTTFCLF